MANAAEATELIELYLDRYGEVPMLMDVKSLREWCRKRSDSSKVEKLRKQFRKRKKE